jgi:hypothetical protein
LPEEFASNIIKEAVCDVAPFTQKLNVQVCPIAAGARFHVDEL